MNSAKKIMNQQNSDSEKKSNTVAKAATSKTRLGPHKPVPIPHKKFWQKCQGNCMECHLYSFSTCTLYWCWHTAVQATGGFFS